MSASKSLTQKSAFSLTEGKVLNKQTKDLVVKIFWSIIRILLLTGLSFVLIYPLMYMITISIRRTEDLLNPLAYWIPRSITAENFIDAFKVMKYPTAIKNNIFVDLISSALQVFSCSLVGYGFARFRFKGRNVLFGLVLFTILVPPQLIIVPSYIQFRFFDFFGIGKIIGLFVGRPVTANLLDTLWTFYLPAMFGTGIRSGLFIFVFRQFFRGMSKELQESAYIDGCSQLKTFFQIMLPNAKPCLVTVALFSIVWYWNDFYFAAMYFTNLRTVSIALSSLREDFILMTKYANAVTDPYVLVTRIQAGCLLTVGPLLFLYLVLQKYFVESIERTGIVG